MPPLHSLCMVTPVYMQATLAPKSLMLSNHNVPLTRNVMEKKEARKGICEREEKKSDDIFPINTSDFLGYFTLLVE